MSSFKKTRVTISDVATRANVSKTIISRFINGKYETMSQDTKLRIQNIIDELGYRPSNIARGLKAQNSKLLGCIIADITSPFSSLLVKGVNDVCNENGYRVLFANTDNNSDYEISSIKSLLDNRVDGIVVNTAGGNDDYITSLIEQGVPICMAERSLCKENLADTVTSNNYQSTYDCMSFLHEQGYEKVAIFTQDIKNISTRTNRYNAFLQSMESLYHLDGHLYTNIVDPSKEGNCENMIHNFVENNKNENLAILVSGVMTVRILHAMKNAGYYISEKLGLCGYGDLGWAELIDPGITTIVPDSYTIGVKSAELLIKRINSKRNAAPHFIELENKFFKSGSTDREYLSKKDFK